MLYRDTRTSKTLAVVVAVDKTDDLAKAGFLGETDFTPSDRHVLISPGGNFAHEHDNSAPCAFSNGLNQCQDDARVQSNMAKTTQSKGMQWSS